jgi:hypothetical protein
LTVEREAKPVGQHLQALVWIGVAEAYHLVVVDLTVPAGHPRQRVEALRLHRDVQLAANLCPLRTSRTGNVARDVILDNRAIEAVYDQRTCAAGALGGVIKPVCQRRNAGGALAGSGSSSS